MMTKSKSSKLSPPSHGEIYSHLERLVANRNFRASPSQIAFLKFVVDQTLAGNAGSIKGYTVATQVFGRGPEFDQNSDPIVSIQANRLRQALERYYLTTGKHDSIRIDMPKGTYVPRFHHTRDIKPDRRFEKDGAVKPETGATWPILLVLPFENLTENPELNFWAVGLAVELADELSRYPDVCVLTPGSDDQFRPKMSNDEQFIIGGSIRSDGESFKVTVQLTDAETGLQIWSDSYQSSATATKLISYQEKIARKVAVIVASQHGFITKTMTKRSTRKAPKHNKVYEDVLRYFEYDLTYAPKAFSQAFAALESAVVTEPECGQAWGMLSRLYADIYAFDIAGYEKPLEKAFEYAARGVLLAPDDQRSRCTKAYVHLLRNDLAAGRAEAEQALALGPNTLFMLDGISFLMTVLGDWERGIALARKIRRLNPFHGSDVYYALWLNWLRHKDYSKAYQEALKLNKPEFFWEHLINASTLGLLGRYDKGKEFVKNLLELKPDFPSKARFLIGHFIKFEEIVERVLEGLSKVGLRVE
jgi:adenylate cyclase